MARNMNVLAIKAGHSISPEVAIFLSEAEQACSIDGSLYAWESGVPSMRGEAGANGLHLIDKDEVEYGANRSDRE